MINHISDVIYNTLFSIIIFEIHDYALIVLRININNVPIGFQSGNINIIIQCL